LFRSQTRKPIQMNSRTSQNRPRIRVYLLLIAVCLVGLMQGTPSVSSSRSSNHSYQERDVTVGTFYRSAPSLRDFEQLFLPAASGKIAPRVLADTADGKNTSIIILLADQADVSGAYEIKDQDARGWFVYNTLAQHAARTQASLQALFKAQGVSYQSYWAANMLVVTADRFMVEQLAARSDVARIDSNKPTRWIEDPAVASFGVTPSSPNAAEWGVLSVNAPAVWAMGFTGQGIVIANQDTGMRWTHAAIKNHYRGWNGSSADHNYNWHDAIHSGGGSCGANSPAPCDDSGHGTHTTGTTSGDDGAGNQIGVAPGAKWIGCRNMDQGNGTPATYTECFQFMIAPTDLNGNNPNPALRPHVINNSWTCPVSEGCTTRGELETIINNTEAAGIFVETSAGNAGPSCSSVSDPPAIYSESFSTGAIDISNTLASFSSRGPSTFYTPNLLKPNISAPGVNVRSSTRTSDTSYGNLSGTSMAGPHVVGVVALLWSARPQLARNIAATKAILQNTANPAVTVSAQTCGGTSSSQIPNNSFGYGRVDALAAVNAAPTAAPATVSGTITTPNGSPLGGVVMRLSGASSRATITNGLGSYRFDNLDTDRMYTLSPSLANYHFAPASSSFSLAGNKADADFSANADASVGANAIDTTEYFVRQQYLDFLGREPDQGGLEYWSDGINQCNGDAGCIRSRRIEVSAAFFASLEFQQTGSFVYRIYGAALARRFSYTEFALDHDQVLGGPNLEANRAAYADQFVQRQEFLSKYPLSLDGGAYVDALLTTMRDSYGLDRSGQRSALLDGYNQCLQGGTQTHCRAVTLRLLADDPIFVQAVYNPSFVLMQYFGYLRREIDQSGYDFWLNVLNNREPNNYRGMVCSFLTAVEYQIRFAPVVSHTNAECG
jgi:serine protease AprX